MEPNSGFFFSKLKSHVLCIQYIQYYTPRAYAPMDEDLVRKACRAWACKRRAIILAYTAKFRSYNAYYTDIRGVMWPECAPLLVTTLHVKLQSAHSSL